MSNEFEGFNDGEVVGEMIQEKWQYPSIGYHSSKGAIMMKDDDGVDLVLDRIDFTLMDIRRCKERGFEDADGNWHMTARHHYKDSKDAMLSGEKTRYRLQAVVNHKGILYNWGAWSWTVIRAFDNDASGNGNDPKYPTGLKQRLLDFIVKSRKRGKNYSPLCFSLFLKAEKETIEVGSGRKSQDIHRLIMDGQPTILSKDEVIHNVELYKNEDLAGWVREWHSIQKGGIHAEVTDDDGSFSNPSPQVDIPDDEVPF